VSRAAPALALAPAFTLAVTVALGAGCEQTHVARGALEIEPSLSMETQLAVLESRAIAQRVSRELGAAAELNLDGKVRARRRGDTRVIELETRDADLRRAAVLCDAVMKVFLERRADMNGKPGARVLESCEAR
jgi:uncharacterized protein involved in exopolysaccharide biosynthesis